MSTQHTRRLAYISILAALSFLLMQFQVSPLPAISFLKFDFSIIPMLLALVIFDLKTAWLVLLVRSSLNLVISFTPETIIGTPMNIIALGTFMTVLAVFWRKQADTRTYLIASCVGNLLMTLAVVLVNIYYAVPAYATFANYDINKYIGMDVYIYTGVIPFNLIQGSAFALSFYLIYLATKPILKKF